MAAPLGSTWRWIMGGAVLAATRRIWIATLGLRELQDVLQEKQREHWEL